MRVAVVSSIEYCNKISEDVALADALKRLSIKAEIVAWDDNSIKWDEYDTVVLRSAWGYHKRYKQFLEWLNFLDSAGVSLLNNTEMVRWNIRKDQQFATLKSLNLPLIPYLVMRADRIQIEDVYQRLGTKILVVKPTVSASGNNTYILNKKSLKNFILSDEIADKFGSSDVIIQPFVQKIETGEYALVFIDGHFSHAVIRFPGIFTEKKSPIYVRAGNIPVKIMDLANKTAQAIKLHFGYTPAYARYDFVEDMIMEVELAEPDLMTRNIPEVEKSMALDKLAASIAQRKKR